MKNNLGQLNLGDLITRNPDIISTDMESETVMMSIERGEFFGLNPVGGLTWNLLAQPHTAASLCTVLCSRYEVDEAECQAAVLRFVGELRQRGLVSVTLQETAP